MKHNIQSFVAATCIAFLPHTSMAAEPAPSGKPLKVYILAGQSNMQGLAGWWVLPALADDPSTRHLYERMADGEGKPRVAENVHVAALSGADDKVEKNGPLTVGFGGTLGGYMNLVGRKGARWGPEWGFGVTMDDKLENPILIIKTAWGGKTLSTDFRPPSAGPYEFSEATLERFTKSGKKEEVIAAKKKATGHYYRLMAEHVRKVLENPGEYHPGYDPKAGYEIAGFAWFQGWNDMGDTDTYPPKLGEARYAPYSDALAHFIRDVRKDFKAPEMPFVIGVMGIGNDDFRAAMAAPAKMEEFKGNVIAVDTKEYLDQKLDELIKRGWMWSERYDKDNKYAQLRHKLTPLQKELDETKKIENEKERKTKTEQIQQRMKDIIYTPEETEYMANNRSSQGFHYFGSPKFFARIGEAFANALIEVEKAKQSK